MSDVDSENAAAEARASLRVQRPLHRNQFTGIPKLKSTSKSKFRMKKVGHNRWVWVRCRK